MFEYPDCRDRSVYIRIIHHLKESFHNNRHALRKVSEIAERIRDGFEKISPLIEQNTQKICPECTTVCCISKHGYYLFEDLVYLFALGLKPPESEFGREDSSPCQFLSHRGCSLKRSVRPSGCTWYFCDALLERMEKRPEYREFDDALTDIAELWMNMIEEFIAVYNEHESESEFPSPCEPKPSLPFTA